MSVCIIEKFQQDTKCNSNVSMLSQNYAGCLQIQYDNDVISMLKECACLISTSI